MKDILIQCLLGLTYGSPCASWFLDIKSYVIQVRLAEWYWHPNSRWKLIGSLCSSHFLNFSLIIVHRSTKLCSKLLFLVFKMYGHVPSSFIVFHFQTINNEVKWGIIHSNNLDKSYLTNTVGHAQEILSWYFRWWYVRACPLHLSSADRMWNLRAVRQSVIAFITFQTQ